MRLLHVAPFYAPAWAYGGMARAATGLCQALARRGHDVTVVTSQTGRDPEDERLEGVRVLRFPGPAFLLERLVPAARGLRRYLEREAASFDFAHLHGHRNGLAITAARVLARRGVPFALQAHGTYPHHGQRRLAKAVLDRVAGARIVSSAAVLLAVSRAEAADLPGPARVVANGVEAPGRAAVVPAARRPRLLFVGSDAPQKRARTLPALLDALPEAELHLVGRFAPRFRRRFARFGDRVVVRGVLGGDELAQAYAGAAVVVHPAVGEAFGLVPFEAALLGTPSVTASGHGAGEWLARAGGCTVRPDDAPALAEAVRLRLGDRELARREAGTVAAFARRELTWDRAAEEVEGIYREALGSIV